MDINTVIGENLQNIRNSRNLSLGQLAERTGLSKAVLSQMEKGNSNPTINTIWKIAAALQVPYSALLEPQRMTAIKISGKDLTPQSDDQGKYRISCYYPSTTERNFEWFLLEFDPDTVHTTEKHVERSEEYVMVNKGKLKIIVHDQEFILEEGDSLHFDATLEHSYENVFAGITQAYCINYYRRA